MMEQAYQTPLIDLLRGVPKDGRDMYEHDTTHHQNVPYGRLCHEAADEIESLRRDAERYRYLRERNPRNDCCDQCGYDGLELRVGKLLDAHIDAAIKGEKHDND